MNNNQQVYDIIGIGIGPFNLGMAAMCEKLPLNCIFFDQNKAFNWHPGLMLPNARMQVPFYADLVTVVDPTSKYTFLNYLRERQRLFKFAIHENNFITRTEYNDYCRWVADDLQTLRFNHQVIDIKFEQLTSTYVLTVLNKSSDTTEDYYAKHIVVGIGCVPSVPEFIQQTLREPDGDAPLMIHSSQYLYYKNHFSPEKRVVIIGSGQSAAEIFLDLLNKSEEISKLSWLSRSERFYPMEYSRLTLEMTSPDYIDHFYSLPLRKKNSVLHKQAALYKGINFSLINEIYDTLYLKDLGGSCSNIYLQPNIELIDTKISGGELQLYLQHLELDQMFIEETDILILATGYRAANPEFLNGVIDRIEFDNQGMYLVNRNYSVDDSDSIFVQNAELHTHGFSAPDLGMGPYRNATILNSILEYDHFALESKVAFQNFGL